MNDEQHPEGDALLQWLARLGHDLRSPLSPIRSATQLLRSDRIDAPTRTEFLDVVDRQVELLVRMAESISDVAHALNRDWRLAPQPLELRALLELAADRMARRLQAAGVALDVGGDQDLVVAADHERAAHLLQLLLDDALARCGKGGRILLEARRGGDAAMLAITHPGKAPDPALLQALPAGRQGPDDGRIGAALFVAARLARAMDGVLSVDQAATTRIELRLPLAG